jgi:hypothetical protein
LEEAVVLLKIPTIYNEVLVINLVNSAGTGLKNGVSLQAQVIKKHVKFTGTDINK